MSDDNIVTSVKKKSSRRLIDTTSSSETSESQSTLASRPGQTQSAEASKAKSKDKDREKEKEKVKKDVSTKSSSANLSAAAHRPARPTRDSPQTGSVSARTAGDVFSPHPLPRYGSSQNLDPLSVHEVRLEDLPSLEGILYKYSGSFKGWKKRVFILKGGNLFYFVHNKQKASIPMEQAVVLVSRKSCRFEVDTGNVVLHLRTKTDVERKDWIRAFTETQNLIKRAAAQQAQHDAEFAVAANRREVVTAKTESLTKTLNLARSIQSVLASQIDLLRSELGTSTLSIDANMAAALDAGGVNADSSTSASLLASDELSSSSSKDNHRKPSSSILLPTVAAAASSSKKSHKRSRSTQVITPDAYEMGHGSAASALHHSATAHQFISQADEFRKTAARFLEASDTLVRDILDAEEAIEKELEKEREKSSKLKERVKELRTKNGSLRKELKFHSSAISSPSAVSSPIPSRDVDDNGDIPDDKFLVADVVTAVDSSDSDSDEYFDPLEFSTMDDSMEEEETDDDEPLPSTDEEESDSDSSSEFVDASSDVQKDSKSKSKKTTTPTKSGKKTSDGTSSPRMLPKSEQEIQRRASLVTVQNNIGSVVARRTSIAPTDDCPIAPASTSATVAQPSTTEKKTPTSAVLSQNALMRRPSVPLTVTEKFGTGDWEATFQSIPTNWRPRESLPADKDFKVKVSLMKILKDAIGKDLSKITIPVQFAEPSNLLQRLVEDLQYTEILDRAATNYKNNSLMRLAHVAAFAASAYSATINRLGKPFNPILGETYEWVSRERQFRIVSEQVSHHPQISALHGEGKDWVIWTTIFTKNKFWGKSLEIFPTGAVNLAYPALGDHFIWTKVTTCVNNVLVGTKWIDNYGDMTLVNQATDEKCLMEYKKGGFWGGNSFEVYGGVYDKNNKLRLRIEGKWSESISVYEVDENGNPSSEPIELWRRVMPPANSDKQYNFTKCAMQTNECPEWLVPILPPTDTRLRPDQRAMENGDIEHANDEKTRLEEKQRAARRALEAAGKTWEPKWFKMDANGNYIYKGGYWECRQHKKWPADLPDLY